MNTSASALVVSLLLFPLTSSAFESDACVREYKSPSSAIVYSSPSLFFPGSQFMCNVFVSPSRSGSSRYDIQAGGLVNVIKSDSTYVHTYQFLSPGGQTETRFSREKGQLQVSQGALDWRFSGGEMSLQQLVHSPSGRSCLGQTGGVNAVELEFGQFVDLGACSDVISIDIGASDTRQSAALKRSQDAQVKGVVDGKVYTCKVKIGKLYDYKEPEVKETGLKDNIVVDPYADPCVRPALQDPRFAGLGAAGAIGAFMKANPGHSCVAAIKRDYSAPPQVLKARYDARRPYRTVDEDKVLTGNESVIYQIKTMAEVSLAVQNGSGSGCRVLASKISPSVGGGASRSTGGGTAQ